MKTGGVQPVEREITIRAGKAVLAGHSTVPAEAHGIVLFAHGSGSSRFSPRNQFVFCAPRRRAMACVLRREHWLW